MQRYLEGYARRSAPLQHKLMDDLMRTISELDIVSIGIVLCMLVLATLWIILPFVVCAVQRSTSRCSRELRALNSKLDQILHAIEVQAKAGQDVPPLATTHATTANGQVS